MQRRLPDYPWVVVASHPSPHLNAPGWAVCVRRTSYIDSSYISPQAFAEDMVLFFRFLLNIETRVSCSLNSSFLDLHTQAVVLIILGCGYYYFEFVSHRAHTPTLVTPS